MATIQQLVQQIRDRGVTQDGKAIDAAIKAFDDAVLKGFGKDFGDRLSGMTAGGTPVSFRQTLSNIAASLKGQRTNDAAAAAQTKAEAELQKILG